MIAISNDIKTSWLQGAGRIGLGDEIVVNEDGIRVSEGWSPWSKFYAMLGLLGTAMGAYHGYKRHHDSIGWGIGWAFVGGLFPIITLPVSLAQGFGKPM